MSTRTELMIKRLVRVQPFAGLMSNREGRVIQVFTKRGLTVQGLYVYPGTAVALIQPTALDPKGSEPFAMYASQLEVIA